MTSCKQRFRTDQKENRNGHETENGNNQYNR